MSSAIISKVASMTVPQRLIALAAAAEKVAAERDGLRTKLSALETSLEIERLLSDLTDNGQCPWPSREEGRTVLHKISAEGRLDAFKEAARTLLPGSFPKVAQGLAETRTTSVDGGRPRRTRDESRAAFENAIMSGVIDE